MIACLFVVMLVGVCGCSILSGTNKTTGALSAATPTLPETYVAGEVTSPVVNPTVITTPTSPNASSANIVGAQVNMTLTETPIACNGGTCLIGSNSTTVNTTSANPSAPISSFSANPVEAFVPPNTPNPNVSVQFTDTSTNSPTSWFWRFGDQSHSNSTVENPVFIYYGYNYYQVSFSVSNGYGQSQSTATIGVCPLVVSFTATPTSGQVPVTVQFTDTSTYQPISWLWNFGDGGTSTLQNPAHTYTASGDYTVRLDATNNLGKCWNTSTISVSPLVASFTQNLTSGLVPLTVQFNDRSTDKPISWLWNFGDGGTSTLQNPVYTYMNYGTYTANLIAYNGYDEPMSSPDILITVNSFPSVNFAASPTAGKPNTTVIFTDQSKGFPSPTSWYWDFGDGFNSSYQNPSHQYVSSGLYNVNHSATNSQGTNWMNQTALIAISS